MTDTLVRIGHSPDPDDAFMFWALAKDRLDTRGLQFEHVLRDIETLNRWALESRLEVTAISLHAYPYLQDRYTLLPHGASMGDGYGPVLVRDAARQLDEVQPQVQTIAIPGRMTSAWLELNLWALEELGHRWVSWVEVPFDEIPEYVLAGKADMGLLIHEGQLTYESDGLACVVDLGVWWAERTDGLPLPLGVNAVRRDLGVERSALVSELLGQSIAQALEHREEALAYALEFGRGLDEQLADRFVGMYVNDLTLSYGQRGRDAIAELLRSAENAGLFAEPLVDLEPVDEVRVDWLEPAGV